MTKFPLPGRNLGNYMPTYVFLPPLSAVMKKVLVDMHRLKYNPFNGLYSVSINLGKALAAIPVADMELYYYLPLKDFGIFGAEAKYTEHRSIDKFYKPGTGKYDLWHVTTQLSWYRPFNKRTKVLYTLYDFSYLIEDAANVQRNKRLLKETQQRIDRADYITGISQFAIDEARKHLDLGNKPTRAIQLGCTVHTYPDFDSPRYRPAKPFLFTIGLVQPRKNFHVLPPLLLDNDYELVIAGLNNYEYGEEVEEAAKRFGVEDRVKLIGPATEEEKYWYYKHCTAFLFPSYAEGFGLPVIEAMFHGKPVFISDKTSLPEVGGDAAYYFRSFDPGDMRKTFAEGMADYATNDPSEKIRQQAAKFNWNHTAAEYIDVYKQLLV
jgi:glycosyltransferase involved in cell wall biosynthesis